jgi:hypothetical protein
MARKRGAKTAAVREMLTQDPEMPAKEIISTLRAKGLRIKPQMVYMMRTAMKTKKPKMKREKTVAAPGRNAWAANPVELVVKVKALSSEAGGMENLKQLVEVLAD